jgi:hypothetical protein
MVDFWNSGFDVAEEMNIDFCFLSLRSSLRLPLRAHLGLAPKVLCLLSTPWTSLTLFALAIAR